MPTYLDFVAKCVEAALNSQRALQQDQARGPRIIFIFPVTFIVPGFPVAMKRLNEGLL